MTVGGRRLLRRSGRAALAGVVLASALARGHGGSDAAAEAAALRALLGNETSPLAENEYCIDWARSGECQASAAFMRASCAWSCGCASALGARELRALRLLAEQAGRAIDYGSLGLGWSHPTDRRAYREAEHRSFRHAASLRRSRESILSLRGLCAELVRPEAAAQAIVGAFLREAGAAAVRAGTLEGVLAALEGELLMPLRALNEGGGRMHRTMNNAPIPPDKVSDAVRAITESVVRGSFKEWRYSNPVGRRQLEGLTPRQVALWSEASSSRVGGLRVHEDEDGELGLFWATKIGGPSHGFDFEGQCILPLLANARHKVVLISDPSYPHHPVGRAHLRLLWTAEGQRPLLWLEEIHQDARADVETRGWRMAVLTHLVAKSRAMGVMLSCDPSWGGDLSSLGQGSGAVHMVHDRLVLRPSNGVVEASDYLSGKHDWVQLEEEITEPLQRAVYSPEVPNADL